MFSPGGGDEFFEFLAGDLDLEVGSGREVFLAHFREGMVREPALGGFGGDLEPTGGPEIAGVQGFPSLPRAGEMVHEGLVDVVPAETGVAVAGFDLDEAFLANDEGDIEGASAEVVDEDVLPFAVLQVVSEGGRSGLVEDADRIEARELRRVLGGTALLFVEANPHFPALQDGPTAASGASR